jgi:hypothetical protein
VRECPSGCGRALGETHDLNIDLVFPIRDDVSAGLMCVKAELLYDAGVISGKELEAVIGRAAAVVEKQRASRVAYSTLGKSGQIRSQRSCN